MVRKNMEKKWRDKNFVLLETLLPDKENDRNFLFGDPVCEIICQDRDQIPECFSLIEDSLKKGYFVAGFFSYELGYCFDKIFKYHHHTGFPLFWFGVYRKPKDPEFSSISGKPFYFSEPQIQENLYEYSGALEKIKKHIIRGDIYQINYTTRYHFDFFGDVPGFYNDLKKSQPVAYSAVVKLGNDYIISLSPELFFRIGKDRKITVKPMKGTAPPDAFPEWLKTDKKSLSENVMIVDLLRNDLSKICEKNSVKTDELFTIEKFSTLLQMTSTISGKLMAETGFSEIIRNLFPCGSVTGAPKIRSMEIIHNLERSPRNIYTGAIGFISPEGEAVFSVAIRTIHLEKETGKKYSATMGVGSGIVFDSETAGEYEECKLKAGFLMNTRPGFALIETMLMQDGKVKDLVEHLKRLYTSASFFSISCDLNSVEEKIYQYVSKLRGVFRVRLLLNEKGDIALEHFTFHPVKPERATITLSKIKTSSGNPFLFHKTTFRDLYNHEYGSYSNKGYFDVIFRNEKDEITEGAISNIFIFKNNNYYTPPQSCGLLNGIERSQMIRKWGAKEKILYFNDLKNADKIFLTNSLRGSTEVTLGLNKSSEESDSDYRSGIQI